jgi:hypothetical protein
MFMINYEGLGYYTVYAAERKGLTTFFLVYMDKQWKWVLAKDCRPVE